MTTHGTFLLTKLTELVNDAMALYDAALLKELNHAYDETSKLTTVDDIFADLTIALNYKDTGIINPAYKKVRMNWMKYMDQKYPNIYPMSSILRLAAFVETLNECSTESYKDRYVVVDSHDILFLHNIRILLNT